ncbi:MAG: DapH/DapD/GlmU-related protein [Methanotrichaceae archaeon]
MIIGGEHRTDWVTTYPFGCEIEGFQRNPAYSTAKGDIHIGNDVWIGMNATILSGVTVGDGAVIGADSVISHDVGDYEIVAGNPAKHIRYRFSEDQIEALKRIRWWDWPIEKIKEFVPLLESSDISSFIRVAGDCRLYNADYSLGYEISKKTIGKAI